MNSALTSPALEQATDRPAAKPPQWNVYRLVMASVWTAVIITLCWLPGSMVREIEEGTSWFKIPDLDKAIHASIFVIFSVLWFGVWKFRSRFLWIAVAGFGLAILTEVVQNLPLIGRDGSVSDAVTDAAGVLIGIVVAPIVEPLLRLVESRVFGKSGAQPLNPK